MSHFLEHVSSREVAFLMIEKALLISKSFVYIQQPYFDENMYLFENNLKFACADWHGHPNMMTTFDFYALLNRLDSQRFKYSICYKYPLLTSKTKEFVNLNEPFDKVEYDNSSIPKKNIEFKRRIYKEIVVLITHQSIDHDKYLNMIGYDEIKNL